MIKLNIGSHNKIVKGYLNVDALPLENVDIVHDLTDYPYPFETEQVDEILMTEVLEHISWRETRNVLKECLRILKVGGKMHIQVPDCGSMMEAYLSGSICENVPHKPKSEEEVLNHKCELCQGRGMVHPNRWLMAFCGAQKHQFDSHLNVFTSDKLIKDCMMAGFSQADDVKDKLKWKIKINAYKK